MIAPAAAARLQEPLPLALERWRQRVERELDAWLPPATAVPQRLHAAQRYSVLGAGKRIRPALVYATAETLGLPLERVDGPACAVELIHCYSLVHDDLPAMDDDDLRRGRPTCHRQFDEATAILAGDSLQVLAFQLLATHPGLGGDAAVRVDIMGTLAAASGTAGMAGGQALDLAAEGGSLTLADLEQLHALKTGALIRASVLMAARCAALLTPSQVQSLTTFGDLSAWLAWRKSPNGPRDQFDIEARNGVCTATHRISPWCKSSTAVGHSTPDKGEFDEQGRRQQGCRRPLVYRFLGQDVQSRRRRRARRARHAAAVFVA